MDYIHIQIVIQEFDDIITYILIKRYISNFNSLAHNIVIFSVFVVMQML